MQTAEVLGNLQSHVSPPLWTGVDLLNHLQQSARLLPILVTGM